MQCRRCWRCWRCPSKAKTRPTLVPSFQFCHQVSFTPIQSQIKSFWLLSHCSLSFVMALWHWHVFNPQNLEVSLHKTFNSISAKFQGQKGRCTCSRTLATNSYLLTIDYRLRKQTNRTETEIKTRNEDFDTNSCLPSSLRPSVPL